MAETILTIEDLNTENTAERVKTALNNVPGVEAVETNLDEGSATITHERTVLFDTLARAVEEAGFELEEDY